MTTVKDLKWTSEDLCGGEDTLHAASLEDGGRITVLDRMTGFGYRDIETGYRDPAGKFWLASGRNDIRDHENFTIEEAIDWIKLNANSCIGV